MKGWLDSGSGDGYDMLSPEQQDMLDDPTAEQHHDAFCMHGVHMRSTCESCYDDANEALVTGVDSVADLDPCRDDTYHLDA